MYFYILWIDKEGMIDSIEGPLGEQAAYQRAATEEFEKGTDAYPLVRGSWSSDPMEALKEFVEEGLGGTTDRFGRP